MREVARSVRAADWALARRACWHRGFSITNVGWSSAGPCSSTVCGCFSTCVVLQRRSIAASDSAWECSCPNTKASLRVEAAGRRPLPCTLALIDNTALLGRISARGSSQAVAIADGSASVGRRSHLRLRTTQHLGIRAQTSVGYACSVGTTYSSAIFTWAGACTANSTVSAISEGSRARSDPANPAIMAWYSSLLVWTNSSVATAPG